jgi:putative flippase GtrA
VTLIRDLYARFQVLIHEVAKFGIVGSMAFVLTVVLVNVFHSGAGLGEIAATTLANVLATVFAFIGNKFWAFRHRKGSHWRRETLLFFSFNGIGILITDGVVWLVHSGFGLTDNFSYNVANIIGIGLATLFRLYCYRRWVFLYAEGEAPAAERLEPETSGAAEVSRLPAFADPEPGAFRERYRLLGLLAYWQPRTADRPRGAASAASCWALVRYPTAAIRSMTCTSRARARAG